VAPHRLSFPLRIACVLALLSPPVDAAALRCDSSTPLTLLGVDTRAQRALFAVPARGSDEGWLLEADFAAGEVGAWPQTAGRFGGSTGPGPVLAGTRCGDGCVQVVAFREGVWRPVGEPILAPDSASLQGTWDRSGAAWLVLHALSRGAPGEAASVIATAYRLQDGDWESRGALAVDTGSLAVYPAPPGEEGVVCGDVRFEAAARPRRWLSALPRAAGSGELVWLGAGEAVHLGDDGVVRSTSDGGAHWEVLRWIPWAAGEGDLAWQPGRDYRVELPDGERRPPLLAVWSDQRVAANPKLHFAQRTGASEWRALVIEAPQGLLTEEGERMPYNHLLRFEDRVFLVTGCVARAKGPALAVRPLEGGKLLAPRLLPVRLPPSPGS
jgi:hypothetical protein